MKRIFVCLDASAHVVVLATDRNRLAAQAGNRTVGLPPEVIYDEGHVRPFVADKILAIVYADGREAWRESRERQRAQ